MIINDIIKKNKRFIITIIIVILFMGITIGYFNLLYNLWYLFSYDLSWCNIILVLLWKYNIILMVINLELNNWISRLI